MSSKGILQKYSGTPDVFHTQTFIEEIIGHRFRTYQDLYDLHNFLKKKETKNLETIEKSKINGIELTEEQKQDINHTYTRQIFLLFYILLDIYFYIIKLCELLIYLKLGGHNYLDKSLSSLYGGVIRKINPFVHRGGSSPPLETDSEEELDEVGPLPGSENLRHQRQRVMTSKLLARKRAKAQGRQAAKNIRLQLAEQEPARSRLPPIQNLSHDGLVAYLNSLPTYSEQLEKTPRYASGKPNYNTPEGQVLLNILVRDNFQPSPEDSQGKRSQLYPESTPLPTGYDDSEFPRISHALNGMFASKLAKTVVNGLQAMDSVIKGMKTMSDNELVGQLMAETGNMGVPDTDPVAGSAVPTDTGLVSESTSDSSIMLSVVNMGTRLINLVFNANDVLIKMDPIKIGPPGAEAQAFSDDPGICEIGNCENGVGQMIFADSGVYSGQFKEGVPHGEGILVQPEGDGGSIQIGQFEDGLPLRTSMCTMLPTDGEMTCTDKQLDIWKMNAIQPQYWERAMAVTAPVSDTVESALTLQDQFFAASPISDTGTKTTWVARKVFNPGMGFTVLCASPLAANPLVLGTCGVVGAAHIARATAGLLNTIPQKGIKRHEAKTNLLPVPALVDSTDVANVVMHGITLGTSTIPRGVPNDSATELVRQLTTVGNEPSAELTRQLTRVGIDAFRDPSMIEMVTSIARSTILSSSQAAAENVNTLLIRALQLGHHILESAPDNKAKIAAAAFIALKVNRVVSDDLEANKEQLEFLEMLTGLRD